MTVENGRMRRFDLLMMPVTPAMVVLARFWGASAAGQRALERIQAFFSVSPQSSWLTRVGTVEHLQPVVS
jgi:hypothetical protein